MVNVIDKDDMLPHFVFQKYVREEIRENTPIGNQIAIVSARDGDTGINAEISYAIVAGEQMTTFLFHNLTEIN